MFKSLQVACSKVPGFGSYTGKPYLCCFFNQKGLNVNKIKVQQERLQVGSNLIWSQIQPSKNSTSYDVSSVYRLRKHYLWCLESVQKKQPSFEIDEETFAEKLLVAFAFGTACLLLCFCVFVVF